MTNNFNHLPFFFRAGMDEQADTLKEAHEAYDIYVGKEYVGRKTLITQTEDINDVVSFLNKQGLEGLSTELIGDHFVIRSEGNVDKEHLKTVLEGYLHNR